MPHREVIYPFVRKLAKKVKPKLKKAVKRLKRGKLKKKRIIKL
jgi:hypothetical protein